MHRVLTAALLALLLPLAAAVGQRPDSARRDSVVRRDSTAGRDTLLRSPVSLPATTTTATARRLSSHAYFRGVDEVTGCPVGLDLDTCERLEAGLAALARHPDPICRTAAARARALLARGRVIVPSPLGALTGDRVTRGDLVLPASWVERPGTLTALLASQVTDDAQAAVSRCRLAEY